MSLVKFSWREVMTRPLRVILTVLSISIGVAAVSAVLLATATTKQAQSEMLKAVSGKAEVEIVANSAKGFDYDLIKQVREVEGVETAVPSLSRFATVFRGEQKSRTQVIGMDPRIDQEVREYQLSAGELPQKLNEMMLDNSFAKSIEAEVGDSLKLLGRGGMLEFKLVGLVEPTGTASISLGGAAYIVLPAAQRLFSIRQSIDQILLKTTEERSAEEVMSSLAGVLDDRVSIRAPKTSSSMAEETMYGTQNGLRMSVAFALIISAFIIYNTFQMAVGERRRQLGVLRAIGATRKQIMSMIMKEAFALSLIGAVLGCLLGAWGAEFLNGATESLLQAELPQTQLSAQPFIIAILTGFGVAMLGAIMPARKASNVQPMEAIRQVSNGQNKGLLRFAMPLGLTTLAVGLVIIWISFKGLGPIGADVVGVVLVLLGFVLLIPLLLGSVSTAVVSVLEKLIGVESKLAQRQLMRHVGRSTLTVGVLFMAIATCTGMAGNIMDNVDNVRSWYARSLVGDFFVRASLPDFATGSSVDLPDGIDTRLAEIDGVESIEPMRFVSANSKDNSILIVAREFSKSAEFYFDLTDTDTDDCIAALEAGQTVIGAVLAERQDLDAGDSLTVETENGTVDLKIAAVTNEYLGGGLTAYLSMEQSAELLDADGASVFVVNAQKGKLEAVENSLQALCVEEGLILQSYSEIVEFIDGMVSGVTASLWMLLALGCIIAAMGLVNTLTMNILEQTREIGMLRVVAMTRAQVRKMIVAQACLLGILGLVPGAIAGVFVAYSICQSSMAVLGHNVTFQFRPTLLVGCLAFGMVVVLLASLIPAERAARVKVARALQYE